MSEERRQLENWVSTIDVKADSVLDVGGITLPIKTRTNSWDVKEYKILDYHTDRNGIETDYIEDLNYEIELDKKFDVIFCTEVMQFIWNPVQAIQNMYDLLNDGGILYINFHFMIPMMKGNDSLRYTHYGLRKILDNSGFKVKDKKVVFTGYLITAIK